MFPKTFYLQPQPGVLAILARIVRREAVTIPLPDGVQCLVDRGNLVSLLHPSGNLVGRITLFPGHLLRLHDTRGLAGAGSPDPSDGARCTRPQVCQPCASPRSAAEPTCILFGALAGQGPPQRLRALYEPRPPLPFPPRYAQSPGPPVRRVQLGSSGPLHPPYPVLHLPVGLEELHGVEGRGQRVVAHDAVDGAVAGPAQEGKGVLLGFCVGACGGGLDD